MTKPIQTGSDLSNVPLDSLEAPLSSATTDATSSDQELTAQELSDRLELNEAIIKENNKATLFDGTKLLDLSLQFARLGIEAGGSPGISLPIPTMNRWRPNPTLTPGASKVSAGFELANGYTGAAIRGANAFSGFTSPQVTSTGNPGIAAAGGNILTESMHDYSNTTGALSSPYLYNREGSNIGFNYAYSGMFFSRSIALPLQMQYLHQDLNAGIGCTEDQILLEQSENNVSYQEAEQACNGFQAENNGAVDWLAGANDPEESHSDSNPDLSLVNSALWSMKRYKGAYLLGETFNSSLGLFQTLEGRQGQAGYASLAGGLALPAAQIGSAYAAGIPLNGEQVAWSLISTGTGVAQSSSTNKAPIIRTIAKQNLLIGHARYMPAAYGMMAEADASGNSDLAKATGTLLAVGGGVTHASAGLALGSMWSEANTAERTAMASTAGVALAINTGFTIQQSSQGDSAAWKPWATNLGSFGLSVGAGVLLKDTKVGNGLVNHIDFTTTEAGGTMVVLHDIKF